MQLIEFGYQNKTKQPTGIKQMTTNQAKISLIALLMFCIAVIMGALSFEDEQLEQNRYCERIANGMPDYNERIHCDILNK